MKHTDSKYWWEELLKAREAYATVCAGGWKKIEGTVILQLYDRPDPDGLFLMYYALVSAIEDYVSSDAFRAKYMYFKQELTGSKGGPQ